MMKWYGELGEGRRTTYGLLLGVILLAIPCYCLGIAALVTAPPAVSLTVTPLATPPPQGRLAGARGLGNLPESSHDAPRNQQVRHGPQAPVGSLPGREVEPSDLRDAQVPVFIYIK